MCQYCDYYDRALVAYAFQGTQAGMPMVNGTAWDTGQPNGQSQFHPLVSTDQVLNQYNAHFSSGGRLQLIPAKEGKPTSGWEDYDDDEFGFADVPKQPIMPWSNVPPPSFPDPHWPYSQGQGVGPPSPSYQLRNMPQQQWQQPWQQPVVPQQQQQAQPQAQPVAPSPSQAPTSSSTVGPAPKSCPTSTGGTNNYGSGLCGCNFRRFKMGVRSGSGKVVSLMGIGDTGTNQMNEGFMFTSTAQQLGINWRGLRGQPFSTEQVTGGVKYGPVTIVSTIDPNPNPVRLTVNIIEEQHSGDGFVVLPMNAVLQAVEVLYSKYHTLYKSLSGGKIVTYDCRSNQVIQGDPNHLWPSSGFIYPPPPPTLDELEHPERPHPMLL